LVLRIEEIGAKMRRKEKIKTQKDTQYQTRGPLTIYFTKGWRGRRENLNTTLNACIPSDATHTDRKSAIIIHTLTCATHILADFFK
jgi:hypothetical protein